MEGSKLGGCQLNHDPTKDGCTLKRFAGGYPFVRGQRASANGLPVALSSHYNDREIRLAMDLALPGAISADSTISVSP